MKPKVIAIDGVAASGKSTLGSCLAQKHNYLYLDTGVMYRAITWYVLQTKTDPQDRPAVTALCRQANLVVKPPTQADGRKATVLLNDEDITWDIASPEVDANVSYVAANPGVRQVLTQHQREIAQYNAVIMVGRDIGTVVLPHADLKIFTIASVEVRAKRRYAERLERGEDADYEQILEDMTRRDKIDRERTISPMIPAEDATIIDTDGLSQAEVLAQVEALLEPTLSSTNQTRHE